MKTLMHSKQIKYAHNHKSVIFGAYESLLKKSLKGKTMQSIFQALTHNHP